MSGEMCEFYQGVCGIDESVTCYAYCDCQYCDIYKEHKAYEEITDDGEW